jgi:hypothetical protein
MNNRIRCFLSVALLFGYPIRSWADFSASSRGTTTANFLKLGVGARSAGLGEAYSAAANDATALYWNPAALTRIENQAADFMHAPYLASTFYDYGAYARRFGAHALGIGIQYFSAGRISATDENNTDLGSFQPYDLATSLGYAYRFGEDGPALGISGKFIQSKILETARAYAIDGGLLSRLYAERWRFAFTVTNLGTEMKFEEESDPLPLALRAGSAFEIQKNWLGTFDLVFPRDNRPYAALGTEYLWHATETFNFASRMGYNSQTQGDISGVTGLSFGMGFGFKKISFDYAFLPYGGVGLTHRISLSLKFGSSNPGSSRAKRVASRPYQENDGLDDLLLLQKERSQ